MGLDVVAYERVDRLSETPAPDDVWATWFQAVVADESMRGALAGLEPNAYYRPTGEVCDFRAGSYSGYNEWRAELCRRALGAEPEDVWNAPDEYHDQPFFLLVNFSDCDGVFGHEAAARLADEFEKERERVCSNSDLHFRRLYDQWAKAFDLASGEGAVVLC